MGIPYGFSSSADVFGIQVDFQSKEAESRMEKYVIRLEDVVKSTQSAADAVTRSSDKTATAVTKASAKQMAALKQLRWQMITVMFFFRNAANVIRAAWEQVTTAAEQVATRSAVKALATTYQEGTESIVASLIEVSNGTLSVRDAISVAQKALLADQGVFVSQYTQLWKAAEVAAATTGAKTVDVFQSMIEGLSEGDAAAIDAAAPFIQLERGLAGYAAASGRTVEQLTAQERAQQSLNIIYRETNELLEQGAADNLEVAQSYKRVGAEWENFITVLTEGTLALPSINKALDNLAETAVTAQKSVILLTATFEALYAVWEQAQTKNPYPEWFTDISEKFVALAGPSQRLTGGIFGALQIGGKELKETFDETFAAAFTRGADALNTFTSAASDSIGVIGRLNEQTQIIDMGPVVDMFQQYEDMLEGHMRRIEKIEANYQKSIIKAERRYNKTVTDVQRDAQRDREKAYRDYERKLREAQEEANDNLEQMQREHELQMYYESERYRLNMLQDERMYQYERGRLVAMGDVLAIEDLDARHALEKQADEESYELRMREAEAMFRLQLEYAKKAAKDQMEQLRQALQDQLDEIDERERERLQSAKEAYDEDLAEAKLARDERLSEEEESYKESLRQWANHWAEMVNEAQIGSEQVLEVLRNYFGPGELAEQLISDFHDRVQQYLELQLKVSAAVSGISGGNGGNGGTSYSDLVRGGGGNRPTRYRSREFGGTDMVSQPTMFMAGEGGPERITFQPQSAIGGAVDIQWSGGAIPVQGTGEFSGVDMSSVGDAIAQGLVVTLTRQLQQFTR